MTRQLPDEYKPASWAGLTWIDARFRIGVVIKTSDGPEPRYAMDLTSARQMAEAIIAELDDYADRARQRLKSTGTETIEASSPSTSN